VRFLDPAFLWGLLALGVPVILHLLLRRRVPILEFPLTRLVLRAETTRQPRKKLNRVLLLIARASLLALLALALARLVLGGSEVRASGPVAVAVVLDDTLSMRAQASRSATRSVFDEGRDMADSLLAALPDGSQAALLLVTRPGAAAALGPPSRARADLAAAAPSWEHAAALPALAAAARLLESSPLSDRRIVVVSDLARHGWTDATLPKAAGRKPQLVLLSPARRDGENLGVSSLQVRSLPGGTLRATARVMAWGEQGARHDADVALEVGRLFGPLRLAGRATLEVESGATGERRFEVLQPESGLAALHARVEPDVLEADDERWAVQALEQRPRVVVVDGDPQNLSIGSESFYLEKALAPGVGLDLDARVVALPDFDPSQLAGTSAVILANVPELSAERQAALETAVRGGLGLVVALGNRVDQRAWNGRLAPLLPASIGLLRHADTPLGIEPGGLVDLPRVTVTQAHALEPSPGARVLLRLTDGSPLLVMKEMGAGRLALLGTTLDRDWNDLPISPRFLGFLHDLIGAVAPRGAGNALAPVKVGERVAFKVDVPATARVRTPEGDRDLEEGGFTPRVPGPHALVDGDAVLAAFAAVPDPIESDLSREAPEEVARRLEGSLDVSGVASGSGASALVGGLDAWRGLLLALVVLLGVEAWLAKRAA
jgi:hypothetical protein